MIKEESLKHLGVKYECFEHYSRGAPCCANCGCYDLRKLQLDHINNDGKEQRTQMIAQGMGYQMTAGNAYYGYLRSRGYPDVGLQVLCKECHDKKPKPTNQIVKLTLTIEFSPVDPIPYAQAQPLWEVV